MARYDLGNSQHSCYVESNGHGLVYILLEWSAVDLVKIVGGGYLLREFQYVIVTLLGMTDNFGIACEKSWNSSY